MTVSDLCLGVVISFNNEVVLVKNLVFPSVTPEDKAMSRLYKQ